MTRTTLSPAVRSMPDEVPGPTRTLIKPILRWITANLLQTDGDREGQPFKLTREQVRILARWYEIDANGRFRYRRGALRRMRGWGKSPFLAVICAVEFLGPCRFDGWNPDGTPKAKPVARPWVQLAAVNLEQTKAVMEMFDGMFSPECVKRYGLNPGKELIYKAGGGKIQCVSASPRALRGARTTFYCLDETSEWVQATGGPAMMERIKGNLAKSRNGASRALEICNAYMPGEDSVAEKTFTAWQKMVEKYGLEGTDLYYDALEAPADTVLSDPESVRHGLRCARGDSVWLDIERFLAEIQDFDTAVSLARRDYLNQVSSPDDALIRQHEFDRCKREGMFLAPGDRIVLGFDGGKTDDATALVALRVSDRFATVLLCEEKPTGPAGDKWQVDPDKFNDMVDWAFATFDVVGFYADVALWESEIDRWAEKYQDRLLIRANSKSAVRWDMRNRLRESTMGCERLVRAFLDQEIKHNGEPLLKRHVLNARERPNAFGISFAKESRESKRKVDALAALILADMARADLIGSGKNKTIERGLIRLRR